MCAEQAQDILIRLRHQTLVQVSFHRKFKRRLYCYRPQCYRLATALPVLFPRWQTPASHESEIDAIHHANTGGYKNDSQFRALLNALSSTRGYEIRHHIVLVL